MYSQELTKKTQEKIFAQKPEAVELVGQKLWRMDQGKLVNKEGLVVSEAMKKAIALTYYRRNLQQQYNQEHNITATTIFSSIKDIGISNKKRDMKITDKKSAEREIKRLELEMDIAAANTEYELAAELRDQIIEIKKGKKGLR